MIIDDLNEVLMADYLRVPHIILKMQQELQNASAYLCLQFIWYKTGGWNKGRDTIAYSQFKNDKVCGTGLCTKTIKRALKVLVEKELISETPSFNNMYEYAVNIQKIRELSSSQAKTICPSLDNSSEDNLSASGDNLSASEDNLSFECGQIDPHNRYITQDTITQDTNTLNTDASETTQVEIVEAQEAKTEAKPKTAKPKTAKKSLTPFPDDFTATEKQIEKCNEYGIDVAELIEEMADNKRSNSKVHACWTSAFNTWIRNHIKFNRLSPVVKPQSSQNAAQPAQQSAPAQYRKTADSLAVNDAWGHTAPMTDEERRAYLGIDANYDDQPAFDFFGQGVTNL